jgi:hypothetical protein
VITAGAFHGFGDRRYGPPYVRHGGTSVEPSGLGPDNPAPMMRGATDGRLLVDGSLGYVFHLNQNIDPRDLDSFDTGS